MVAEKGRDVSPRQVVAELNRWYDRRMYAPWAAKLYDGSDFHNYGYWDANTRTPKAASENLMEQLLSFIPLKKGTILDVACGKGATTRHLLNYYDPDRVTAINISEKQIETSKLNVPGCKFLIMDATELNFEDNYFDNIICVEAAMHFNTREKFLSAAWRVLKPGGRLALSDIPYKPTRAEGTLVPACNYVRNRLDYTNLYLQAGFAEVVIIDATKECWVGFYENIIRHLRKRRLHAEIDRRRFRLAVNCLSKRSSYLLVCARKSSV
jgi:MPBQ/MSBQ methyltransferase